MVRVTARQAFTRSRVKKLHERDERAKQLNVAKKKFQQLQLSVLGVSIKSRGPKKANQALNSNKTITPNRKITDYYSVRSRGTENIPLSPPQVGRSPEYLSRKLDMSIYIPADGQPIVITLDDTDEESENEIIQERLRFCERSDDYSSRNPSISSDEPKPNVEDTSPTPLRSPFNDPNFSIKLEDDLEIVDILPPIPLRDHPVVDLEV